MSNQPVKKIIVIKFGSEKKNPLKSRIQILRDKRRRLKRELEEVEKELGLSK